MICWRITRVFVPLRCLKGAFALGGSFDWMPKMTGVIILFATSR